MDLSRDTVLWFAGLYEGEGSLSRNRNSWVLNVGMTDEDVINKVKKAFGGWISVERRGHIPTKVGFQKNCFRWSLANQKQLYALCVAIYSFLGVRRKARFAEFFENFKNPTSRKNPRPHKKPGTSAVLKRAFASGLRTVVRDTATGRILGSKYKAAV